MRRTQKLLDALAKQNFSGASPELRAELLEFYGHPDAPYATKRKPKVWAKVQAQLEQLKTAAPPVVARDADDPSQYSTGEDLGTSQNVRKTSFDDGGQR